MTLNDTVVHTPFADLAVTQSTGQGFPLVMLHGSGANRGVFAGQLASSLADEHRLIAIDLPGHGASTDATDPQAAYTFQGLARAVGAALEALHIDRAAIFGWSLGGHVAIEMLATNPVVAGIMITGTPPVSRGPIGVLRGFHTSLDVMLASKPLFSHRDIMRFANLCYGDNSRAEFLESIERADGRLRKIVFNGMMRGIGADQKRTVETASVPVAIVNGEREPIGRLGYINGLNYSSLWEDTCHVIADAGHAPFIDRPDAFDPLLARFAADVAAYEAAGYGRLKQTA